MRVSQIFAAFVAMAAIVTSMRAAESSAAPGVGRVTFAKDHFRFLPPLAPRSTATGAIDSDLEPTVQVRKWTDNGSGDLLAEFSSGGGQDGVRFMGDSAYACQWSARGFAAVIDSVAIDVIVAGTPVGEMVLPISSARTFPIRFAAEWGLFASPATDPDALDPPLADDVVDSLASYEVDPGSVTSSEHRDLAPAPVAAPTIEDVITAASSVLGTPYEFGAKDPTQVTYRYCRALPDCEIIYPCVCNPHTSKAVDCSGLVTWAFSQVFTEGVPPGLLTNAAGLSNPANWNLAGLPATAVDIHGPLQRGDLLFFQFGTRRIDHVAIYLGNNLILQSLGRCDCRGNKAGKQGVVIAVLSSYYTTPLKKVLRFGNTDLQLDAFFVESCNISSTCPTPGCLRAGRDYTLELSLKAGAADMPAGSTVTFRVDGTQLGGTVAFVGRYVDSDQNFLSVPFRPAPGQTTRLTAEVKVPGAPVRTITRDLGVIFDDQVLVKHGEWSVQASVQRRRGRSDHYIDLNSQFSGTLRNERCNLIRGQLALRVTGTTVAFGASCSIPTIATTCEVGCVSVGLARTSAVFGGSQQVPVLPCEFDLVNSVGADFIVPPNFSFDLRNPGVQTSGDATVTVSYEGPLLAPHIHFTRTWDFPLTLSDRETGTATVDLVRVDTSANPTLDAVAPSSLPPEQGLRTAAQDSIDPAVLEGGWHVTSTSAIGGVVFHLRLKASGIVRLMIFDAQGRRVGDVINAWLPRGDQDIPWEGRTGRGARLSAGIYFASLHVSGTSVASTKVAIAR